MPFVTIANRLSFYEDCGSGRPLVLLHAFPLTSEIFLPQLQAPPPGVRLIVPDYPGFGRSAPSSGPLTMEALAEAIHALLDALHVPQAMIGGVSMGGYVAIAMARQNPGRVQALLLIDTQSSADDEAAVARREAVAQEVETRGMAPLVNAMLPKLLAARTDDAVKARVAHIMQAQQPEAMAAASRGMRTRTDGGDVLSRFHGACLIVVGAHDTITPIEKARAMVSLMPQARLAVIPKAAHLPNLENPEVFNAVLCDFIAQHSAMK